MAHAKIKLEMKGTSGRFEHRDVTKLATVRRRRAADKAACRWENYEPPPLPEAAQHAEACEVVERMFVGGKRDLLSACGILPTTNRPEIPDGSPRQLNEEPRIVCGKVQEQDLPVGLLPPPDGGSKPQRHWVLSGLEYKLGRG